jgi:hypothetical protein
MADQDLSKAWEAAENLDREQFGHGLQEQLYLRGLWCMTRFRRRIGLLKRSLTRATPNSWDHDAP